MHNDPVAASQMLIGTWMKKSIDAVDAAKGVIFQVYVVVNALGVGFENDLDTGREQCLRFPSEGWGGGGGEGRQTKMERGAIAEHVSESVASQGLDS